MLRPRHGRPIPLLTLAMVGLVAGHAAGQPEIPLVTDRPDFTESALTVPSGHVQLESGYTFTHTEGGDEHALGEALLRVGVLDRLEARIGLGSYAWVEAPGDDPSGFEDPSLGLKVVLAREETAGLAAALLAETTVPVGDDELGEDDWQPEIRLAVSRDLSDVLALAANLGIARASQEGEGFDQKVASLSLGIGLGDRWGAYAETYGNFPAGLEEDDEGVLNGGLTFLVRPLLQLDARAGAGVTDAAPDFFAGVGLSKRW
ncbi:MAG TPA: transporter [Gemmatimonadota bacterium]|nr:transporter [Gemmatimonadota bacterium]